MGQKPKSELKEIELSYCHHLICLKKLLSTESKKHNFLEFGLNNFVGNLNKIGFN